MFREQASLMFWMPRFNSDGWSDQGDKFPTDRLQWLDTDSDDFGDNPFGDIRDDCPDEAGQSTIDRQGCPTQMQMVILTSMDIGGHKGLNGRRSLEIGSHGQFGS